MYSPECTKPDEQSRSERGASLKHLEAAARLTHNVQ